MLPEQFKKGNEENIFIYHYIEELVTDYSNFLENSFEDEEITLIETPYLLRIRFVGKTTQKELVNVFKVSEGYAAKLLRKFEDKELIERYEDPTNHRRKIVKLTDKGIKKADKISEMVQNWENETTTNLTEEELKTLKRLLYKLIV